MSNTSHSQSATIGSWIKLQEHGEDEPEVFYLGQVTKPLDNQLASDSPMGQSLLGAKPGDEVTVEGPVGPIKFAVLDVGQNDQD